MLVADLVCALVVAGLLSLVLYYIVGWRAPGHGSGFVGVLFLFLVLFLGVWAGGVWFTPVGPPLFGGYWLPFVLMGIFLALLTVALAPPAPRPAPAADVEADGAPSAVALSGCFLWVLIAGLAGAIAARYIWGLPPAP
jgi:hypothetical protein